MTLLAQVVKAHNIGVLLQAFDASWGGNWVEIRHSGGRLGAWVWWHRPLQEAGFAELGVRLGALKVRLVAGIAPQSSNL